MVKVEIMVTQIMVKVDIMVNYKSQLSLVYLYQHLLGDVE